MSVSDIQMRNEEGEFQSIFPITIAQGGTGATSASAARTALGITLANLGASDYVVAQGTSGGWEYIKFNSGIAICAGYTSHSRTGGTAWGGIYYDSGKTGGEAFPFSFASKPRFFTNIVATTGEFWLTSCNDGSTTAAPHVYALTGAKNSSPVPVIRYQLAIGWWK